MLSTPFIDKIAIAIALDNGLINRYCSVQNILKITTLWVKKQQPKVVMQMENYLSHFNDDAISLIASDPESELYMKLPVNIDIMLDDLFDFMSETTHQES